MLSVLYATVFMAAFGLILRYAQREGRNIWAVALINYVVATLFHLVRHLAQGGAGFSLTVVGLGAATGLFYALIVALYPALMSLKGISVTSAIVRLAVLIPVSAGILFWGERPSPVQAAGAALAVAALVLFTIKPGRRTQRAGWREALLMAAIFLAEGIGKTIIKGYQQGAGGAGDALFLTVLFATAGVFMAAVWASQRQGTTRRDILPGLALGLVNAVANAALVAALRQLPGVLVFPFTSAVSLALVAVSARLAWSDRVTRTETAGIVVALAAVTLINLV